jgi:hypothetical protein
MIQDYTESRPFSIDKNDLMKKTQPGPLSPSQTRSRASFQGGGQAGSLPRDGPFQGLFGSRDGLSLPSFGAFGPERRGGAARASSLFPGKTRFNVRFAVLLSIFVPFKLFCSGFLEINNQMSAVRRYARAFSGRAGSGA